MTKKNAIYITKQKKLIKQTLKFLLTKKVYLNGGVGLSIDLISNKGSKIDIPTKNELGIETLEEKKSKHIRRIK